MPKKSQDVSVRAFDDIEAVMGAQVGNPPILSEKRAVQKTKGRKAGAKKVSAKKAA